MSDKLRIDWPTPGKSVRDMVPVPNFGLTQLPAKIDLLVMVKRGKIHEPDVEVLDLTPDLFDALKRRLQGTR